VGGVDEAQRTEFGPGGAVVGDLGGVVPAVDGHGRVQPGGAGAQLRGAGVAAGDLVGEDQLEELAVAQLGAGGQGETFGQGVEGLAELDAAQQRPQLG